MPTKVHKATSNERERGATLVEFALIFPIFMALVLGAFSGGQSYDRKLTLTNAAREASRYGATLPVGNFVSPFTAPATNSMQAWLVSVATAAEQNAIGDLGSNVTGRSICVAYVHPNGNTASPATPNDRTTKLVRTGTSTNTFTTGASETCFADGRPANERRVQVRVSRPGSIQTLFYTYDLTISAQSFTRFEAAT